MATPQGPDDRRVAELFDLSAVRARRDGTATNASDVNDPGPDSRTESDTARTLVDSITAQAPPRWSVDGLRGARRRPIVPGWARSKAELLAQARWAIGFYTHAGLYHVSRSPKYAAKLTLRAPRGAVRLVAATFRWVTDAEGAPVRAAAVRRENAEEYLKLSRQRDGRVRLRTMLLIAIAIAGTAAVFTLLIATPRSAWYATLAALVGLLGLYGAPADRPLLDTAVSVTRAPKLTSDVVIGALSVLGIAQINQAIGRKGAKETFRFAEPISRDGPGWRAVVDLPPGVTVDEVADRRDKLASGLGRPLGCVWPEGNAEIHPGRLTLWVGDEDLSKSRQPTWPLLRTGVVSLFEPIPFGTDQRGRPVMVTLMFASMVIGSIPRVGKTFAARLLLLAGALDPIAELHAFDLKGMGDFSALDRVAHRYRAGSDEEDIAYGLADMRDLAAELNRRTKVVRGLPKDICPESKITPELARKRSLRLHPILLVVDECQRWFEHPLYGDELRAIAEDLVRRGPAAGIIAVFATQRPDSKSLPTGISGNAVLRFCLKVMGQTENDMVLGTSAYKNGTRATMFSRRDLGIGYLAGEDDDPRIVRTFYVDNPTAEAIADRARQVREEAGTLTGRALGEQDAPDAIASVGVLDDIAAVVPTSEAKVWNETVAARLAELRPDVYAGWSADQVTAALKPHQVRIGQVWGTDPATGRGANRRGFERAHLTAAITERNRRRRAG